MKKLKKPTAIEDRDIDRAIAMDEDTWEATDFGKAKRGRPFSLKPKQSISIRLDADIIAYFKAGGPGWQTRLNAALRVAAGLK